MADMITRCPACETSFRITEAQLNTAKGAVRCGSCLQIFRAADNLVPPRGEAARAKPTAPPRPDMPKFEYTKPVGSSPTATTTPPASSKKPAAAGGTRPAAAKKAEAAQSATRPGDKQTAWQYGEDDNWQFDKDAKEFGDNAGQENMLRFDQSAIDAADDETPEDVFADDDLLISDEMALADDEETPPKSAYGDDLSEGFLDLDSWKPAEKSLFDRGPKAARKDDDDDHEPDESWAVSLLEDDDDESVSFAPPKAKPPARAPESKPIRNPLADLEIEEPDDDDDEYDNYSRATTGSFSALDDDDIEESHGAPLTQPGFDGATEPNQAAFENYRDEEDDYFADGDRSELLSRIEPAPVEFAFYQGRPWRKRLLWGGLVSPGLLLLVGQVAWLQFDTLSRKQPYRDIYAALCPMLGCQVPSLAAPNLIRTSNLVVRSHPRAQGALMVDTILLNTAAFQQPFPDLVLSFSNVRGETLAARRFTPREYLAGELAGRTEMPSNQPVHLSLEILDPGPDAVSYSAYIPD
ncbi:MAG: DUF3426 domain-containing protein [Cellvibrionaceae bacterium]